MHHLSTSEQQEMGFQEGIPGLASSQLSEHNAGYIDVSAESVSYNLGCLTIDAELVIVNMLL